MKKIILTLILIACLLSCEEQVKFQDARIYSYAFNVQSELATRGIDIDIDINMFLQSNLEYDGKSVWGLSRGKTIWINQEAFNLNNEIRPERIETLVAHELCHNRLNLDHINSQYYTDSLGRPQIMHLGSWQYITDENIGLMYDHLADYLNK